MLSLVSCQIPLKLVRDSQALSLPPQTPELGKLFPTGPIKRMRSSLPHGPISFTTSDPFLKYVHSFFPFLSSSFPAYQPHLWGSCSLHPRSTRALAAAAWVPSASLWQLQLLWQCRAVFPLPATWRAEWGGLSTLALRPGPWAVHVRAAASSPGRASGLGAGPASAWPRNVGLWVYGCV